LSIRFLPGRLRQPVGLAYLLARATDTIADTTEIPAETRLRELESLASAIQGSPAANVRALQDSFAPLHTNRAERTRIESLPNCRCKTCWNLAAVMAKASNWSTFCGMQAAIFGQADVISLTMNWRRSESCPIRF